MPNANKSGGYKKGSLHIELTRLLLAVLGKSGADKLLSNVLVL